MTKLTDLRQAAFRRDLCRVMGGQMAEQAHKATSNSLGLLTGYMFEEMDKLSEIDINADPDVLEAEVKRAKALGETAKIIVENAQVILEATRMRADFMGTNVKVPRELDG